VRETFGEGGGFEEAAAYSRAVRAGSFVAVSGTAPLGPDGPLHPGNLYLQTLSAFEKALGGEEKCVAAKLETTEDVLDTIKTLFGKGL